LNSFATGPPPQARSAGDRGHMGVAQKFLNCRMSIGNLAFVWIWSLKVQVY